MNNNKKILKRSFAAFLAALNIFNFAGGSSKAEGAWSVINEEVIAKAELESKLEKFLDPLKSNEFADISVLKNSKDFEKIENECIGNCVDFYNLKSKKVLFLDFFGDASLQDSENSTSLINSLSDLLDGDGLRPILNRRFIIYKIEDTVKTQKKEIIKTVLDNITGVTFIDADDIDDLKLSYCDLRKVQIIDNRKNNAIKLKNDAIEEKKTAVKNSEKADSKVRKLRVVAGLGWTVALVNLGYVFQNELKNACGTVYKKVLELKNKMLG